jgi:predicted  nucleic acid-binding Zn ribbon protein
VAAVGGQSTDAFEVTCPHCGKSFEAELIDGPSDRLRGFKCPHCRLFTPYARAEEQDLVDPAGTA